MAIIDFHIHFVSWAHICQEITEFTRRTSPQAFARSAAYFSDPQLFLNFLDEQGVDVAVILAQDTPKIGFNVRSREVWEFCKGQPRLLPFASINLWTEPRPATALEEAVQRHGVRGLKLYPSYQHVYLNQRELYPLYAMAEALGIPIMAHIGSSVFPGAKLKYCDPMCLDEVAVDFPRLRLVMAHSGRGFWQEACSFLARMHPNVYLEISGLPPEHLLTYLPQLPRLTHKVVFGTDWPSSPLTIAEHVARLRKLPLSEAQLQEILYDNAARLLGLPAATAGRASPLPRSD